MNDNDAGAKIETELDGQYALKKVEEMIDMAFDIIPHWPSVFRYTRGERIMTLLEQMEELCVAAHLKYFKKSTLQDLDIKNHQLQLAIRGARRKSFADKAGRKKTLLQPGGYEKWARLSLECGNLIGGWKKTLGDKGQGQ